MKTIKLIFLLSLMSCTNYNSNLENILSSKSVEKCQTTKNCFSSLDEGASFINPIKTTNSNDSIKNIKIALNKIDNLKIVSQNDNHFISTFEEKFGIDQQIIEIEVKDEQIDFKVVFLRKFLLSSPSSKVIEKIRFWYYQKGL